MNDEHEKNMDDELIQVESDRLKYKKRMEEELAQAESVRLRSKKRRDAKKAKSKELFDEYSQTRKTGVIEWIPKHNPVTEKWIGKFDGKNIFIIERRFMKYELKVTDEFILKEANFKKTRETDFYTLSAKAEQIIKEFLESDKKQ